MDAAAKIAEVTIHPVTLMAQKGGKEIDLTLVELRVLAFFIANRGRIVSQEELFTTLWKHRGTDRFTNIVNVYVNYLRGKIGKETIETVRGEGFRFAA